MSHSVPADAPQDVAVTHRTAGAATETVPVTVVVPVRDGADFAEECLDSVLASRPDEVIVVDGGSSDGTLDATRRRGLRVVTHEGSGPASARMAGAALARHDVVVLLDVDVVLPAGALARWYEEFRARDLAGLQADLAPESLGTRYWGRSLAEHQRISRARRWFTLCATMLRRDVLLEHGIDDSFASGEDIEFRHRLHRAGEPVAVSRAVQVRHRFRDGFTDARHQWEDDGAGLALTIRKNGVRDLPLSAIPAVGFVRGLALTVLRRPQMLGYWCCYLWFNYVALVRGLLRTDPHGLTGNSRSLALTLTLLMGLGFVTWAVAARAFPASDVGLAAAAFSAATLVSHLATSGPGNALVLLAPSRPGSARRLTRAASGAAGAALDPLAAGVLLAVLAGRFAPSLAGLVDHPGGWLAFLALVVAISWAYLYDHVAIAVRRSADALRRSVVQAGLLLMAVLVLLPQHPTRVAGPWAPARRGVFERAARDGAGTSPAPRPFDVACRRRVRSLLTQAPQTWRSRSCNVARCWCSRSWSPRPSRPRPTRPGMSRGCSRSRSGSCPTGSLGAEARRAGDPPPRNHRAAPRCARPSSPRWP